MARSRWSSAACAIANHDGLLAKLLHQRGRRVLGHRHQDVRQVQLGGGGILLWLGCHYLDLLRFVLADDVRRVAALTGTRGGCDVEVEDTVALSLEWESGALGSFTAGYHLPRSRFLYRLAAGFVTRRGYRAARRAGFVTSARAKESS